MKREFHGLLTPEGTLLYANGAALQLINSHLEDVVGKPLWETPWVTGTPDAPKAVRELVEHVNGSGQSQSIDLTLKLPSGTDRFDLSIRPIKSKFGEIVALVPEADRTPRALSEREKEVLAWTAKGKTAAETAAILGISSRTVEWHAKKARQKINAVNITQTIALAIKAGLISLFMFRPMTD